jgi:hypothetical protein
MEIFRGGGKTNLSYLIWAVSWQPRYTLTVGGDHARLTAWADIRTMQDSVSELPTPCADHASP